MRYAVLAADYDGTLAHHGVIDEATFAALERLKKSGRSLVLVTGRDLDDLLQILPRIDLFDRVVAENGGVLYSPADRQIDVLGEPPPGAFVEALRARGVSPLAVGRVIVASWEPNETTILEAIRDLGLELQVIFNKGAVMVLPAGVNKATGLDQALADLRLSHHNAVGIGDAENDHAFLTLCEYSAVVSNALPGLKDRADWVTHGSHGSGVAELIDRLVGSDLQDAPVPGRHRLALGTTADGQRLTVSPHGTTLLVAGPSGSGKSTVATAVLERLVEARYQVCLVDPEGDYTAFEDAIVLGDNRTAPTLDDVLDVLKKPAESVVAVLLGLSLEDRPPAFEALMARLFALRAETGRPHWIVLDEAHHLLPAGERRSRLPLDAFESAMLITVHADEVARDVLEAVNVVLAVGPEPSEVFRAFAAAIGVDPPECPESGLEPGEAVAWFRNETGGAVLFRPDPPHGERLRHRRKYAEGTLGPDKSFYFRGADRKLQLRAQNLGMFLQLAHGVDDDTWLHHLRLGDYSRWIRESIKDGDLADEISRIEADAGASPGDSRAAVAEVVGRRYTA